MRNVAVVGFAQSPSVRSTQGTTNGVEMLVPVLSEIFEKTGLTKTDIDFWCSGSSDYLAGRAFSFIAAVDAIGAFPPINESHVECDAAWAVYEAWIKILTGEADTALVYGFGKSSAGELRRVLSLQLDPYTVAPLWPDSISLAAMQARLGLESGRWTKEEMAAVAARSLADATSNPHAQRSGALADNAPLIADPLHSYDVAPISDGAAALILTTEERARDLIERPAIISGIDHRIDSAVLGARDLTDSPSTRTAAAAAGARDIEIAELHAPFSHQELILREALELSDAVRINPSGGPLAGNPMFAGGLIRIGEAAKRVHSGEASRVLAHATSGPLLQQNLVAVMEAQS
ncbi:thiolase domain-containing protein [Hoyosella altamirensis]|uniref:Acetyl-CoA acetyltransferase n=1 Tax=Hoyosella altamirensis TaxID=616997 RepID=A0A839RRN6_9ACTN|nr:thiolase domain-containing protein [Hoyosella altamirensis]MBB3039200.1 acetyl-CoA acetyltransferase [Hoyosella altamirensis]